MKTIEFERVVKRFPGATVAAVDHVSLTLPAGAFIVLLGPSGCGKTTLLKMINRLYEPDSGRITIDGADIQAMPATTLRQGIGYVIQQVGLFPHMSVAENVAVVPKLLKWDRKRIAERVDTLLELIHLDPAEYRDRYPAQLSGGQQQRVGLARALAADPGVMLMDEPFGAIDAITRTSLQNEMLRLQRQLNKTIVFVTHDVEEALRLADQIVIMRQGQVVQFATPMEILARPADAFVAELVGADDIVRQLGVVRVATLVEPLAGPPPQGPMIASESDVRSALGLLLSSGADTLPVEHDGAVIGSLSLARIRALASGAKP